MRERLRALRPDLYLLGEIWHDASQWLAGDEYDSVMNYPLLSGIHDFLSLIHISEPTRPY